MTTKERLLEYCNQTIKAIQIIAEAKQTFDDYLKEDPKRLEAVKAMIEHDPAVIGAFGKMEEEGNKIGI